MSRIGKLPITLPKGVEVKIDGNKVTVKGPQGRTGRNLLSRDQYFNGRRRYYGNPSE